MCGAHAGQASTVDGAGQVGPFVADDVNHFTVVCSATPPVPPFGSLTNHEASRGLGSFFGSAPEASQLLPETVVV